MGQSRTTPSSKTAITLFLCGDVMTGRAIDQVLPHPGDPRLHEPYVHDARGYVRLAALRMTPIRVRRFRVNRASEADMRWLRELLNREGERFGTRVEIASDNTLNLHWGSQ